MLKIRYQRKGRKNDPSYRLVVIEKRSKPQSGEVEILGSYNPKTKNTILKKERILHWISKGAQLSPTARNLLISREIISGQKINVVPKMITKVESESISGASINNKTSNESYSATTKIGEDMSEKKQENFVEDKSEQSK